MEEEESPVVRAIIIGAGQRGAGYAEYAKEFPNVLKIVGVAEPRKHQREKLCQRHDITEERSFHSWEDVLGVEKFADCVIIGTPDSHHKGPAVAFAAKGYHILLEKPMATSVSDCLEIVRTCRDHDVMLSVCHVLRYTPQAQKVREIIDSGQLGDVVNIQLLEPVGYWHFAHSFVRGNWHNESQSTFSLLAKSCHDLDLLCYWMGNRKCTAVTSFGSLRHFKKENKPPGASERCLDCAVHSECPYSAKKIYLIPARSGSFGWPVSVITDVPDIENVTEALRTGPYGKCVYDCDNDVCDNQVVNLQFEDGATASFTMVAFSQDICRRHAKIFGTKGELTFDLESSVIKHCHFVKEDISLVEAPQSAILGKTRLRGHSGADFYAMQAFVQAVAEKDVSRVLTGPGESLRSHLLVFAAEEARRSNRVVNYQDWLQEQGCPDTLS